MFSGHSCGRHLYGDIATLDAVLRLTRLRCKTSSIVECLINSDDNIKDMYRPCYEVVALINGDSEWQGFS